MKKIVVIYCIAIFSLILMIFARLAIGEEIYNLKEIFLAFSDDADFKLAYAVRNLRWSNVVASIIFGTYISLSGYMLQKITQNNIAEPSILGLSSFVVLIQLILKVILGFFLINIFVNLFISTMIISIVILFLINKSKINGVLSIGKLILYGIGLNLLLSSIITFIKSYVDASKYEQITMMTNGNLDFFNMDYSFLHIILIIVLIIYLLFKSREYELLSLDINTQQSLGMNFNKFIIINIIIIALLTSITVLSIGVITLLGLITPQIIKKIVGNKHKHIIVLSPMMAAIILMLGDLLSRYTLNFVIPLNYIIILLVVPMFIIVFIKERKI